MKEQPPLKWTPKQKLIYKLIQQQMKPGDIRSAAKVSYSSIQSVKNAIAKGEVPTVSKKVKKVVSQEVLEAVEQAAAELKAEEVSDTSEDPELVEAEVPKANATPPMANAAPPEVNRPVSESPAPSPQNPGPQSNSNITSLTDSATLLRVVPIALTIPLTPVMMNARAYCIQKLHWPENVRWEDMLDTVIVNYFRTMKIELAGWYEIDDEKEKVAPKTAGGNGNGNGNGSHIANEQDPKGLAANVIQQIIDLAKAGQL